MVNYGIVGCGPVFERCQAKALLQTKGLRIAALCDLNERRLKDASRKYNVMNISTDYHRLLDDKIIDVITVNLPQHLHLKVCQDAARAGKHVYVEKPIATTLKDAKGIIDICKKNKVKLCVGHQRRFINVDLKVKDLIRRGFLGEIFKIQAEIRGCASIEGLLSKDAFHKKECGGGSLMGWGVHKMDTVRFLLGQEAVRVYAEADNFVHRDKRITVEDQVVALMRFNKGAIGQVVVTSGQYGEDIELIQIWGDKGTLSYNPRTGKIKLCSMKKTNVIAKNSFMTVTLPPDGLEMVRIHTKFIESIRKNIAPPVTGEEGYKALEMVVACYKSAREHKPVTLPLDGRKQR